MTDISTIYANGFRARRHGDAMWFPDMPPDGIHIGDVGFIDQGAFTRLFNSVTPDSSVDRLPDSFQSTEINTRLISRVREAIPPGPIFSPGIDFDKETPKDSEPVYRFTCNDSTGAILILPEGADRIVMVPSQRVTEYVFVNHQSWYNWAKDDLGLMLNISDIIFVRGYYKADKWTVAAFESSDKQKTISGRFSLAGELIGHQLDIGKQNQTRLEWRSARPVSHPAEEPEGAREKAHTVFLTYYKVTPRAVWRSRKIVAGAGYHDPGGRRDDGVSPAISAPNTSHLDDTLDAHMDSLIDYIFTNSEANIAMVGTEDVEALLVGHSCPADFTRFLAESRPRIDLNKDKGGTISLVDTVRRLRRHTINKMSTREGPTCQPPQNPSSSLLAEAKVLFGAEARKDYHSEWPHVRLADSAKCTAVVATSVSAGGQLLVAAHTDKCVRVWRVRDGQLMQRWYGHGDAIQCVAITPNTPLRVASGSADGAVIIWDVSGCKAVAQLDGHSAAIASLAYSPDGRTLASASFDSTVKLWGASGSHEPVCTMGGGGSSSSEPASGAAQLAFTPDGTRVVSVMGDTGHIWDAHSGTLLASLRGHTASIRCMVLSPDGDRVVTGSDDGTCRVWDANDGREVAVVGSSGPVVAIALSPDGKQVVCGSRDAVETYATDDGRVLRRLIGPADTVPGPRVRAGVPLPLGCESRCVACCPFGTLVASGAADGSVRLWNKESGEFVGEYRGHEGAVRSVVFSGDGRDLYSASDDGSLRIWSATDLLCLLP